jgi:hypothetical protein
MYSLDDNLRKKIVFSSFCNSGVRRVCARARKLIFPASNATVFDGRRHLNKQESKT